VASKAAFKPHDDGLLLDQGDILAEVPLVIWKDGKAQESKNRAVVTSHGCVCEDYERAIGAGRSSAAERLLLQVAPLRPAKDFKHKIGEIQRGELLDRFFVEGDGKKLAHQVADLTREQPIPASVLVKCKKIARLADWQWEALLIHMTIARFRIDPAQVFSEEILKGAGRDGA
jgi:hypothetical protein